VRTVALDWGGIDREKLWRLLGGSPRYTLEEKTRIVHRLPGLPPAELETLFEGLQRQHDRILQVYRREAAVVEKLYDALAGGDMADVYDVEAAVSIAENEEYRCLPYVALQIRVLCFLTPEALPESELQQADAALRRLMEHELYKAMAWQGLGNLLQHRLGRYGEAEQAYRRAIELDPQNALPWMNLGYLLSVHLQRYEEAEQAIRRATELDPQNAWPWMELSDLLSERLQRHEEAEQALRRAIELDPQNAGPWIWLGKLLSDHFQRYEEAEQAFRRAIELDPQNAWAWSYLGYLLSKRLQRYDEAERAYRRAIEVVARDAFPWENLGELLQDRLRRHAEGAAAFLKALELDPARNNSRVGLLEACRDLLADSATQEQAIALVRRGLELLADDNGLKASLAQGLVLAGQWPEAQTLLAEIAQGAEWEPSFTSLFTAIIATDHAKDALAVLEQAGAHESWRPLYEALRAAAEGSAKYLRRIAPEVRVVAEEILREIAPHLYES
ncbi:MAG: tetratricopeptide repeat protein, partial [Gammaproteobacteria bacterium]